MKNHILKVEPYSEAEERLMELFNKTSSIGEIIVRIGEIFGWPYNEYEFSEERYQAIRNYLETEDPE